MDEDVVVESQIFLSIIIKCGKRDFRGIEAVLTSHGLEPIWVLVDRMSKEHDFGVMIYKQETHYCIRVSLSNSPILLLIDMFRFYL